MTEEVEAMCKRLETNDDDVSYAEVIALLRKQAAQIAELEKPDEQFIQEALRLADALAERSHGYIDLQSENRLTRMGTVRAALEAHLRRKK